MATPLIEARDIIKYFGSVIALAGVSLTLEPGEVHCLLGDNGAGKSTLIKVLSGVWRSDQGAYLVEGQPVAFDSPRDALDAGIATVFQDLAMVPLMSVTRNFFMGREPVTRWGPFRWFDFRTADNITRDEMRGIGIEIRDPEQPVGTLSGGERQCLAIARAVHFGAKVLILDEPTSALGVAQTSMVLKHVHRVRRQGLGVIFITHNVRHALAVGDRFTVLNRGRVAGSFSRGDTDADALQTLMAGGKELQELAAELEGTV
ncbi:MAG TPA: ATP-binding cassette domain-containing protein [Acetobacteraceae bacterium]|nr:ATP-binding cassette domain-containing protein [Acetobacteraceae bacterium]